MHRFWEKVIKPVFEICGIKSVVEIGAQNGCHTKKLIEYAVTKNGRIHSIDPEPNFDYKEWERKNAPHFVMHPGTSLDVLHTIEACDVYLVDGDHNWYTVFHELHAIKEISAGKDCMIMLHDIGWPYARRDLYYHPEAIPEEYRNPYERRGVVYGQHTLDDEGVNGHLCNAVDENTPRNGVMTAVEDFLHQNDVYEFWNVCCCNGFGILKRKGSYQKAFSFLRQAETLQSILELAEADRLNVFQQRYHYKMQYDKAFSDYNKEKLVNQELKNQELAYQKEKVLHDCQVQKEIEKISGDYQKEKEMRCELETEIAGIEAENEKQKEDIRQYKSLVKKSETVIEELREEGKRVRKENRMLSKELDTIRMSKRYRYASRLAGLMHMPGRIYHGIVRNTVPSDTASPKAIQTAEKEIEVKFPDVLAGDNHRLFDPNCAVTTVSVVVCVHNAFADVAECLCSLWDQRTFPYEVILIDDGSEAVTRDYLREYAEKTKCRLHRNETALGYTKSANIGLRLSQADYIVLLNSDTVVTGAWVEKMLACFDKKADTGIVSPFSNAATYQSIPHIKDEAGKGWKINTLDEGVTAEAMALIVEKTSIHKYPAVSVLNGFCFMIKRAVIDAVGYLDEADFPKGYGEEVDYCLRAVKAGFCLRIADDTYIFHKKTKSFSDTAKKQLGAASKPVLSAKHGEAYTSIDAAMENHASLQAARAAVAGRMDDFLQKFRLLADKKIAFYLTARGGSGGANSVCQEVMGMRRLGIQAYIINSSNYKSEFTDNYPELEPYVIYYDRKDIRTLLEAGRKMHIIIGTIFTTIENLYRIKQAYPHIQTGYYIQDYEPYFYEKTEAYYKQAKQSYTLIKGCCMFAKTDWIAQTVHDYHNVKVYRVKPSIDTRIYNPFVLKDKPTGGSIQICAMIRPKTKRRNPKGTMDVLKILKDIYHDHMEITLFGCAEDEIKNLGDYDFAYTNRGVLRRWEVAALLAKSDIFLDMSDYQAFGRTGLESMCLGCIPVLPKKGGADEFAADGKNAVIVDTADSKNAAEKICAMMNKPDKMQEMRMAGIMTGRDYNIMNAVWSEILLLAELCGR